jgi:tripartite-type tricarboxylate transporter receptor subunit TctC
LNKALAAPIFTRRPHDAGLSARSLTVDAFGDFIKRDAARRAELVKLGGAQAGYE